jgi:hypothetical protein
VQRSQDVDQQALRAMLRPVLGPEFSVARTPAGMSTQMYRVDAARRVVYVRIAEDDDDDLAVDAALLEHLGAFGLRVPQVVHVEPFNQALGRSVLIMSQIAGEPLAGCRDQRAARRPGRFHFHLWEHQRTPLPLWDDLLAGYGEVTALPAQPPTSGLAAPPRQPAVRRELSATGGYVSGSWRAPRTSATRAARRGGASRRPPSGPST